MRITDRSVEDHINSLPGEVQDDLVADVFSGEPRVVWEGKFWGGTDQQSPAGLRS